MVGKQSEHKHLGIDVKSKRDQNHKNERERKFWWK